VQVIIDTLDVNMTGMVCWTDMVKGPVAPYFFDGKEDYEMRSLLCDSTGGWPLIYEKCKEREKMVRRLEKGLLPDRAHGVLPAKYFEECLTDTPALNLRDDPKTKLMLKKIVSTCEGVPTGQGAFLKEGPDGTKIKDRNDKTLIDYEKVCRHYAGASFDAEREFERKWEVVIEVLKELKDANIGRQLSRETFKMRLSDSALHISDATIDFLLRDQPAATVDMDAICWRTAKSTILKILKIKWSLLMQLFRIKDPHNKMRLSKEVVQQILDRADVGMSTSLVEILMSNLLIEDDGKIDYDKLLSGKLKSGSFPMDVYTAYKTMETEWETLSTHFWEYDLNGDGLVDHEEFKMALRSLQHPALSDASVISDLIKHLDPDGDPDAKPPTDNIDFDRFSWNMARGDLKQVVDQRGNDVLKAFRKEATRLFDKHKGFLPVKDSIEAIHRELADLNVKPILVKILVSRAESFRLEGANKKGTERKTSDAQPLPATAKMLTEEHLLSTLREVSGDIFKKAEESRLRDSFMDILHASKLETVDKWRLKGEDGIEIKTLWGAASLGPDAMRYVGQVPYKRLYLHPFLDQGGKNMLESMKASPRLVQIKEDRVQTIYSRDPWISFWQQRSKYRSPAMATPNVSTSTRGAAAPRAQQPGGSHAKAPMASMAPLASSSTNTAVAVGSGKKTEEADIPWQRVCQKVKKAAFDRFHTNAEAIASLDPENSGAGAIATQTLRQALEGLVLSLSASELDMITEKLDAGHDGMVLKSDIAHYLLPEDTNRRVLERLAAERHARGVYARLRTRQGQGPSPDAHSATSAGRNVRPEASGAGERWDVPDPYEYQYRFAWNRVQHPQSYPSSHFGAAGSAGTDLQAARPIAHPAASGHPQSAIGIGPRAPSPSHGASLVPGYLPSERGGGRDSSRPALYHSAPSSTLTRYMAAGPRYPSPTVGSQPVTSSQQQPPSQFW
jgi:Ca2+-binding EF-hand superfamily protein